MRTFETISVGDTTLHIVSPHLFIEESESMVDEYHSSSSITIRYSELPVNQDQIEVDYRFDDISLPYETLSDEEIPKDKLRELLPLVQERYEWKCFLEKLLKA